MTLAAVANSILCIYPNTNKLFIIYPNASQKYAMGAMLAQVQDGVEQISENKNFLRPTKHVSISIPSSMDVTSLSDVTT
ncbi:hypothetical protein ACHAW6_008361 [Cyclotella cf. meneghiniana]